jgi:hypothetical protein
MVELGLDLNIRGKGSLIHQVDKVLQGEGVYILREEEPGFPSKIRGRALGCIFV